MATKRQCLASIQSASLMANARPRSTAISPFLLPFSQTRNAAKSSKKPEKRKKYKAFRVHDKKHLQQFTLCEALRYLRAFEVGHPPASVSYDLALKLQTNKDGAVLRDKIRLPHPCGSDTRIAVVCKEGSKVALEARADGAVAVGEEKLIEAIKAGTIEFNRLLCHIDSAPVLMKAGLGPVLGPRGLMPNLKNKTITDDVRDQMRELAGTANYRERQGVVRIGIGKLNFSPEMIARNIQAFLTRVKADIRKVEHNTSKQVDEVVLSSTNGPGFSLNGQFRPSPGKGEGITPEQLVSPM